VFNARTVNSSSLAPKVLPMPKVRAIVPARAEPARRL
jgi:hypothetical protein